MSWAKINAMGITLRPFDNPPESGGTYSPFDAKLSDTLTLLERELRLLDAKQIVLQVGYRERDLRLDGMPRANSVMQHGAVALSFESKWGPLRYETNEFTGRYYRGQEAWASNLRAVALAMEALRKGRPLRRLEAWRAVHRLAADPADDRPDSADDLRSGAGLS